jgi:hypothetical protein
LSETVAVPTVFPPEQSVGADACGPNTLNVIVPPGDDPPDSVAEIDLASMSTFFVPPVGALSDSAVAARGPRLIVTEPLSGGAPRACPGNGVNGEKGAWVIVPLVTLGAV